MIDIKFLRENAKKVEEAAKNKRVEIDIDKILDIDLKKREIDQEVQLLREKRNAHSAGIKGRPTDEQIEEGKKIKVELEQKENTLSTLELELKEWLLKIPNPAKDDVKIGKNDTENDVIKKVGEPTKFSFTPKDHLDIGQELDIIDVERADR
jgi:seryl-tRNA synthetase